MQSTVILSFLILFQNYAYVTNNILSSEISTKSPIDKVVTEIVEEPVAVRDNSDYIYLDDIVFGLKTQNWTSDEALCLNQTLSLIRSLQNFTLWAVWEWDSVSSQPLGILSGNRYQLGNFDQCMEFPWNGSYPEIKTQYCLAEVELERDKHVKKKSKQVDPYESTLDFIEDQKRHFRPLKYLTWGACVPASCKAESVERLVSAVLARSHLGAAGLRPRIYVNETCQRPDQPREFDIAFYSFISVTGFCFLVCLLGTYLKSKYYKDDESSSIKYGVCKALCLKENTKNLLTMKKDGIEITYGIRFLTICFIVICHQVGILNSGPISNGVQVDEDLAVLGWLVLHDDVFVDTFFAISGFLVAKALVPTKKLPNIFLMIFKRYIRLVVALSVAIFYVVAILPYTGSGPLWTRFMEGETNACRNNWWLNLLMVSNYFETDNVCIVVSWYIPCDFHFFVVTVAVFWLYKQCPRLGLTCAGALFIVALVSPGVVNYVNNLEAIQLFTFDFVSDPRGNENFQITYIKSHTRAAAYFIGFAAGYLFVVCKAKNNVTISKTRSVLFAGVSLIVMLLVIISGTTYLWRNYTQLEGAFYAALNRPVWAAAFVVFLLTCSFGTVPLVTGFLSWYPWVPLSRLSYGIYLFHTIFIIRNVAIARNPIFYDNLLVFLGAVSVVFQSTIFAYIVWLLFEAPINNLFMLYMRPKIIAKLQENSDINNDGDLPEDSAERGKENFGYLRENMSETPKCLTSKM